MGLMNPEVEKINRPPKMNPKENTERPPGDWQVVEDPRRRFDEIPAEGLDPSGVRPESEDELMEPTRGELSSLFPTP